RSAAAIAMSPAAPMSVVLAGVEPQPHGKTSEARTNKNRYIVPPVGNQAHTISQSGDPGRSMAGARRRLPLNSRAMSGKHIRVVAAVIEREGSYLITQRRETAVLPLLWEFPGGRVEENEGDEDALRRELRERLDTDAKIGRK